MIKIFLLDFRIYAHMYLNSLIRMHGSLPDDYCIIGFDNSPISSEAVIPTSTVGQQIDKIAEAAMEILVKQMNERKKEDRPLPAVRSTKSSHRF